MGVHGKQWINRLVNRSFIRKYKIPFKDILCEQSRCAFRLI